MMAGDIEDLMRRVQALEAHVLADERRIGELSKRLEALEALALTQSAEIASLKRGFASLGRFSF